MDEKTKEKFESYESTLFRLQILSAVKTVVLLAMICVFIWTDNFRKKQSAHQSQKITENTVAISGVAGAFVDYSVRATNQRTQMTEKLDLIYEEVEGDE